MIKKKIISVCLLIIVCSMYNFIDGQRDPFFLPEKLQSYYVQKTHSEARVQVHGIIEHNGAKNALVSDKHTKLVVSVDPGNTSYNLAQSLGNSVQLLSKDEQLCLRIEQ